MEEFYNYIIPILISVAVAVLGYIKSFYENKRIRERMDPIENVLQSENKYFINCPSCGTKIMLAEVVIKQEVQDEGNNADVA